MQQARQMGTANGLEQRWCPRDVVPEGCGARGVEASGRADEIDAVDELRHAVLHLQPGVDLPHARYAVHGPC